MEDVLKTLIDVSLMKCYQMEDVLKEIDVVLISEHLVNGRCVKELQVVALENRT